MCTPGPKYRSRFLYPQPPRASPMEPGGTLRPGMEPRPLGSEVEVQPQPRRPGTGSDGGAVGGGRSYPPPLWGGKGRGHGGSVCGLRTPSSGAGLFLVPQVQMAQNRGPARKRSLCPESRTSHPSPSSRDSFPLMLSPTPTAPSPLVPTDPSPSQPSRPHRPPRAHRPLPPHSPPSHPQPPQPPPSSLEVEHSCIPDPK